MDGRERRINRKIIVLAILLLLFMGGFAYVAHVLSYGPVKILRYYILVCTTCYLAYVDMVKQIVPNRVLLALAAVRAVLFLPEMWLYPDYIGTFLWSSVIGSLSVMAVLFAGYFVCKKGMGLGDIKLFGVIGWYVGPMTAFAMLLLALCIAAVCSVAALLAKRIDRKAEIPFVPFVFAGMVFGALLGT